MIDKKSVRKYILSHFITRECFFFIFNKKADLKKIDHKIKKNILRKPIKKIDVIVSLTTYGERLKDLHYTLYSLVSQTYQPEKIIVNLAKSDYNNIPPLLRLFEKYGVEFFCTEDLKSYKKLIPTIARFPNKVIVTADDDLFYKSRWLEKLWKGHLKYPTSVICHLTKTVLFEKGKLFPYNRTKYNKKKVNPSLSTFILSGAGALFPIGVFYKDVCNINLIMELCPYADDIWDYFMCVLNKVTIMQIKNADTNLCYINPYREYKIIAGDTLSMQNVDLNMNDSQFLRVMKYYNFTEESFEKYINSKI